MEPPLSLNGVTGYGESSVSPICEKSPTPSAFRSIGIDTHKFARKNGLLLAWNCLSVLAIAWTALNFWKFILLVVTVGGVGFILVTLILSPVLTFAMKATGFVKNNLRFIVLVSWRGVSTRGVELSQKVRRCC